MMNAKDLARKMLVGCGHTQPIIVPHADCVEIQLAQWEANIRLDCARTLANVHRQAIDDSHDAAEKARLDVERITKRAEQAERSANDAMKRNDQLREKLRVALLEVDNLRASLRAENMQKQMAKYPQVISE